MDAEYDLVAETYHEAVDPNGMGMTDPIFDDLVGDVRGQRTLALACGQGRDARAVAAAGAVVTGVDLSERLLGYALRFEEESPRGIRYLHGNAQDLQELDDHTFDGVACHMALMDIPELALTIASVARVLRPGGWFVFSIVHPCYAPHVEVIPDYGVDSRYEKLGGWQALPAHAYHRPLSTYINTLTGAGLSITRMIEPPDDPPTAEVPNLLYARCEAR